MKRSPNIDSNSLRTPYGELVTAGHIETLQQLQQESPGANTSALPVGIQWPTSSNSSIISTPLYSPTSDSPHGTTISSVSMSGPVDGQSFVIPATLTKQSESVSLGLKYDDSKPPLAYIPKAALYAEAEAFAFGAKKYDAWNYRNGIAVSRTLGAALRHIYQFLEGEDKDEESGAHHLGSARANLAMALDTLAHHPKFDDRFKGEKK